MAVCILKTKLNDRGGDSWGWVEWLCTGPAKRYLLISGGVSIDNFQFMVYLPLSLSTYLTLAFFKIHTARHAVVIVGALSLGQ